MARLFFFGEKKYVSIGLPLPVELVEKRYPKFRFADKRVERETWSWLIACSKNGIENLENEEDFVEFILKCEEENYDFRTLFNCFLDADYGYVRYDEDIESYQRAVNKHTPHHHPLHHFDIHLSSYSTFKTGLYKGLTPNEFIQFLDNGSDRWYIGQVIEHKAKKKNKR